jgi:hypothetical protein
MSECKGKMDNGKCRFFRNDSDFNMIGPMCPLNMGMICCEDCVRRAVCPSACSRVQPTMLELKMSIIEREKELVKEIHAWGYQEKLDVVCTDEIERNMKLVFHAHLIWRFVVYIVFEELRALRYVII